MLGWTVSCSVFWVNTDTTRYSATEFGRNRPTNFCVSGTLMQCFFSARLSEKKSKKVLCYLLASLLSKSLFSTLDLLTIESHAPSPEPAKYDKTDGQWYTHDGVDNKETQQRKGTCMRELQLYFVTLLLRLAVFQLE